MGSIGSWSTSTVLAPAARRGQQQARRQARPLAPPPPRPRHPRRGPRQARPAPHPGRLPLAALGLAGDSWPQLRCQRGASPRAVASASRSEQSGRTGRKSRGASRLLRHQGCQRSRGCRGSVAPVTTCVEVSGGRASGRRYGSLQNSAAERGHAQTTTRCCPRRSYKVPPVVGGPTTKTIVAGAGQEEHDTHSSDQHVHDGNGI